MVITFIFEHVKLILHQIGRYLWFLILLLDDRFYFYLEFNRNLHAYLPIHNDEELVTDISVLYYSFLSIMLSDFHCGQKLAYQIIVALAYAFKEFVNFLTFGFKVLHNCVKLTRSSSFLLQNFNSFFKERGTMIFMMIVLMLSMYWFALLVNVKHRDTLFLVISVNFLFFVIKFNTHKVGFRLKILLDHEF